MTVTVEAVEQLLFEAYIAAPEARLRKEDRKKAQELAGLLDWIGRILPTGRKRSLHLIDAAAGKGYVGLGSAVFVLGQRNQAVEIVAIERSAARLTQARAAFSSHAPRNIRFVTRAGELSDPLSWPSVRADLVVALHACQSASDDVAEQAIAHQARHVLIAPCCVSNNLPAAERAAQLADLLGFPNAAELRRPFVENLVLADRVLRLAMGGYETKVVPFVASTVTPHNRLLVGRWVGDASAMQKARAQRQHLWAALAAR